eukprot:2677405-Rhodomonas_salina.1
MCIRDRDKAMEPTDAQLCCSECGAALGRGLPAARSFYAHAELMQAKALPAAAFSPLSAGLSWAMA